VKAIEEFDRKVMAILKPNRIPQQQTTRRFDRSGRYFEIIRMNRSSVREYFRRYFSDDTEEFMLSKETIPPKGESLWGESENKNLGKEAAVVLGESLPHSVEFS